jgi:hypothetical protein
MEVHLYFFLGLETFAERDFLNLLLDHLILISCLMSSCMTSNKNISMSKAQKHGTNENVGPRAM